MMRYYRNQMLYGEYVQFLKTDSTLRLIHSSFWVLRHKKHKRCPKDLNREFGFLVAGDWIASSSRRKSSKPAAILELRELEGLKGFQGEHLASQTAASNEDLGHLTSMAGFCDIHCIIRVPNVNGFF